MSIRLVDADIDPKEGVMLRFNRTSLNTQIHQTALFICLFSLPHTEAHVRYDLEAHS